MASIFNILSITLFLAIAFQAYGQPCYLSNIKVTQTKTSDSVWNVSVISDCVCMLTDVTFNMTGFKSSTHVDPSILSEDGLLIQGQPLYDRPVTFNYTSHSKFTFTPTSFGVACS